MPAFTKKTVKFVHQGINFNRSVDTIPDGQVAFGYNIRVGQQGEVTGRSGVTLYASATGAPRYGHSISRLNNYSPNLPFFTYVYVYGADQQLLVGRTPADFLNAGINPVKLPPSGSTGTLSGNPLTLVDATPQGGVSGWKYIGDSSQMLEVGYYPGDTPGMDMARALTVGLLPPVWNPNVTAGTMVVNSGGLLTGSYQWCAVFRREYTGAVSNPSAGSRNTLTTPAIALTNNSVTMVAPVTPIDPLTGAPDTHMGVDIYRFGGLVNRWAYVATVAGGATFTDNLADSQILSNPAPSQVTDPITGLARFNKFMPFPIQDAARFNTPSHLGTVTQTGNGVWLLTVTAPDSFNVGILQGSTISINNVAFTVYQVRTNLIIEIAEDATGILTSGSTYAWAIPAGTLIMGQPCAHIWGPYGTGNQGSVLFGCGNPDAPDTLFWTNGNDPDSSDIANSLVVTSPSEPLRGGCVFNGVGYVWSTERMFRIYPQFGTGQYYTQEVGGGHGLWLEWSLNIQSNSISDQSISWRGKDGIYNYTEGGGTVSLTDASLYPLFPHENEPGGGIGEAIGAGGTVGQIFPFLNSSAIVPPPDDTQPQYHRLTWFQGVLYYDYVGLSGGVNYYLTAIMDAREAGGWVAFDGYLGGNAGPVSRSSEIAANNLKLSIAGSLYDWIGTSDAGVPIPARLVTRQDECDDPRAQKLFGDLMMDLDPGASGGVSVFPRLDYGNSILPYTSFATPGRAQAPMELSASGLGILSRTFGLDISWSSSLTPATLYQYVFAYVPKPEITGKRALDKTDDGYVGAKYLRGFVIETNTFGVARKVNVLVDGIKAVSTSGGTVFTVSANGQLELPFAVFPVVGYEFQIAIDASDTSAVGWEVFQVRWVYEQWPDLTRSESPVITVAGSRLAYIRGFTLPLDTNGAAVSLQMVSDAGGSLALGAVTTVGKTGVFYEVIPPMLGREVQFTLGGAARAWWGEIAWDAEPWPELTDEYSPWLMPVGGKPCHLRGFTIPVDTNGAGIGFSLKFDDGTTYTASPVATTTPTGTLKSPVGVYLSTPKIVHSVQIRPVDLGIRCWWNEIVWDAEAWPELEPEYSAWIAPKGGRAAYLRGFVMPVDTNGAGVSFSVQLASGALLTIQTQITAAARKSPVPFSFIPPVIAHEVRIQPNGAARCWFDEITWDAEEYPELIQEFTPVMDCGYARAKFMQGCVLPIDTNGAAVQLQFIADNAIVPFTSQPITTNGKQFVALSWTPFITHSIQIVEVTSAARIWWGEIVWVFEPSPEVVTVWQTPFMTHGMNGYLQQRLFWLAYLATAPVVFTRKLAGGGSETYNLPSTGGVYVKALFGALPTKFLAAAYSAISIQAFQVYVQDSEAHTKEWGGSGTFQAVKMIGSPSVVKGADI